MPSNKAPPTLEAIIDQDIDDIDAYLVYADWLQQQGDPRGEFILLCHHAEQQHSPAIAEARDQYLKDWGGELLGDLYELYQRAQVELSWRLGFVDHYQIAPAVRVLVKAIGRQLGRKWGNSKYLYELYAYGPAKQACLYGGIPVAHGGCI
jgi:tRNA 2-thiouridine synthesizing protein E